VPGKKIPEVGTRRESVRAEGTGVKVRRGNQIDEVRTEIVFEYQVDEKEYGLTHGKLD
jgi:hypothetical protein